MKNIRAYSLTKTILKSSWIDEGLIDCENGTYLKAFEIEPISEGLFEDNFQGPLSDGFFQKLSDLLTRLPNHFDGQIILFRSPVENEIEGLQTKILVFEKVKTAESFSFSKSLLSELGFLPTPLKENIWQKYLATVFGKKIEKSILPDVIWEKDSIKIDENKVRALSLTELPQITWKGCFQQLYESKLTFSLSLKFYVPDRKKIKRQLETKRRFSHALSVTNSLEVRNIESNSVLSSSEETLERILVDKETLFEISVGIIVSNHPSRSDEMVNEFERVVAGIGNAGIYTEEAGSLPVITSHLPGGKTLNIRKLPILSENLAHIFPLILDYSRCNDESALALRSRNGEVSNLNLFSKQNLNFNAFCCGTSGSGKSYLMNAILASTLKDEPNTRLCIFDIGGSYRRIIESNGGVSRTLTVESARGLIKSFLKLKVIDDSGFFKVFIETLCGSGAHITHSHRVAIEDLLRQLEGKLLNISELIKIAQIKEERFYQDIAHWLKPHQAFDNNHNHTDLSSVVGAQVVALDFKDLDADPILQQATILLLSELIWTDLMKGTYSRTLIVFDEVWRFFAHCKSFLEELYRTLRKYKGSIVSITQNLSDYGDEAFAKMIFTNSFTKIFLQNGATADYLKHTFDLTDSDISRALSVTSKKPYYSEFFVLSSIMSQIFRLYSTSEFYNLANTENIAQQKEND